MVERREEHGKEVDHSFRVVFTYDGKIDARQEEKIAQREQEGGQKYRPGVGHFAVLGTVPATVALQTEAGGVDHSARHVVVASPVLAASKMIK